MTVLNILKKDWRLLWPLIAALTVLQGLLAFARFRAGQFLNGLPTAPMAVLELLAVAIVIILVVHQDPIPGVRQDWLVRPIARGDLFLAKLIFVVVLVQGRSLSPISCKDSRTVFHWVNPPVPRSPTPCGCC